MEIKHPPSLYIREGVYYLRWRESGRKFRRSIGKLDANAAEAIRAKKEAELRYGVKILSSAPTLHGFVTSTYLPWVEATHPSSTAKYALAHPLDAFGSFQIDRISAQAVEQYKADRLKKVRSATVNKEVRLLKAVVRRAMGLRLIEGSEVLSVRPPRVITSRVPTFFSKEELETIYAADKTYSHLWRFLANTGLRRAEMAKATRDDVVQTATGYVLHVESLEDSDGGLSKRTKPGKSRTIPLNGAAIAALRGLGSDRLVDLTPNGITQAWQYNRERIKKKDATKAISGGVHKLRHTFCSHLVMAGIPLRTVMELAGHGSVSMTEKYSHLAPGAAHSAVAAINL